MNKNKYMLDYYVKIFEDECDAVIAGGACCSSHFNQVVGLLEHVRETIKKPLEDAAAAGSEDLALRNCDTAMIIAVSLVNKTKHRALLLPEEERVTESTAVAGQTADGPSVLAMMDDPGTIN
jgi:hypothetical protein